jgi:DNA-directed RNA polymerase specialized sigma24 family protein
VTDGNGAKPVYSPEEMCTIIDGLSNIDMDRLALCATRLANTMGGVEAKDLLHHALLKAALGDRRCPKDVNPIVFLRNAMKSELFNLRRKSERTESATGQECELEDIDDDTPEIWAERAEDLKWAVDQMKQAFGDDDRPMLIFEGRAEGMSREEIRELVGMDSVHFESLEKKLRRFVNTKLSARRAK